MSNLSHLTVEAARQQLLASIEPLAIAEVCDLKSAKSRINFETIKAIFPVPSFDNSAMDGYALAYADLKHFASFTVVGTAYAGKPFVDSCKAGECVQIMTGAPLPKNTDAVVMQENVLVQHNQIIIEKAPRLGENIRVLGGDLQQGDSLITQGKKINAADLALLACAGIHQVKVYKKPVVAIFSTGDELYSVGQPLEHGKIYDSNRYLLSGLLQDLAVDILDLGIIPDDVAQLYAILQQASAVADVIITSGGVSVGSADYVKDVLQDLGQVFFWQLAIKPGKPVVYGRIQRTLFFGLPGNPVSAMVTFDQLVRPGLETLMGKAPSTDFLLKARCSSGLKKKSGRKEYQRGVVSTQADGSLTVCSAGSQDSFVLSSAARANCYIVLPIENTGIKPGDWVEVQLLDHLFI